MSSSDSHSDPLDAIVEEFVARLRRGERPAIGEYTARYPEHAAAIQEMFPALVVLETLKPTQESALVQEPSPGKASESIAGRLGDFRIVREIGRGGMGVVYEAIQESLGRHVALKVLPRQTTGDFARQARFEREARAAARLHHTNIVPVFEVGDAEGWHFYAMQYIHGLGLDEVLRELRRQRAQRSPSSTDEKASERAVSVPDEDPARRSLNISVTQALFNEFRESPEANEAPPDAQERARESLPQTALPYEDTGKPWKTNVGTLSNSLTSSGAGPSSSSTLGRGEYWRSVARVGAQAASALQYAHDQGVLHRDIKPSNLLLDTRGVVWLTDFGLAKTEDQHDLTRTGDVLGTLRYMAPEAFSGASDARSDMYSLGLTLYEMLSLRQAYDEADRGRLIRMVLHESPPRLRTLDPSIPRDLETIIHKAIDREPAHRYGSARELAEDLQRFLNDEPIEALRVSLLKRGMRWCRRNPLIAGLTTTVALLLIAAIGASGFAALRLSVKLNDRNEALVAMESAQSEARGKTKEARVASAKAQDATFREQASRVEVERQRERAQVNYVRARGTIDKYLSKIADQQLLSVPGLHSLREELLAEALRFYDELAREQANDASIEVEVALALHRRGTILRELGRREESTQFITATIQKLESLRQRDLCGIDELSVLAEAYLFAHRYDDCVALCTSILDDQPDSIKARSTLSEAYNALAVDDKNAKQFATILSYHQKAFAIREQLVVERPDSAESHAELGATLNNIGALLAKQKRSHEALSMYEWSLYHTNRACTLAPHSILWGRWDSIGRQNVSQMQQRLQQDELALKSLEGRIAVQRRIVFQNPSVESLYTSLNQALTELGDQQKRMGRIMDSRRSYREALEVLTLVPRTTGAEMFQLALLHAGLMADVGGPAASNQNSNLLEEDRQYHEDLALESLVKAVEMGWADQAALKTSRALDPLRQQLRFVEVESAVTAITEVSSLLKETSPSNKEVLEKRRKAAEVLKQYADGKPGSRLHHGALAATWEALSETQLAMRDVAEAEKSARAALDIREQRLAAALAADSPLVWRSSLLIAADKARTLVAKIAWSSGDYQRAFQIWQESLTLLERHWAEASGNKGVAKQLQASIASVEVELANRYGAIGLFPLARQYVTRAVRHQAAPSAALHNCLTLLASLEDERDLSDYLKKEELWEVREDSVAGKGELLRLQFVASRSTVDPERLRRLMQSLVKPSDRRQMMTQGYAQYLMGEYEKAKGTLIANYQALWQFPFALAMMEYQLGNHENAERMLRQGEAELRQVGKRFVESAEAELHPPELARGDWWEYAHFVATRRLAWALIRQQSPPEDPWIHLVQARGYHAIGENLRAADEYASALALGPKDLEIHLAIVWLERRAGANPDQIVARLDASVAAFPSDPRPLIWRGRWYAERGEQARADADYASAAVLTPHELNRFLEAGWWGVGPYHAEIREFCPPELTADPAASVLVCGPQRGTLERSSPWTALVTGLFGRLDLNQIPSMDGNNSAYAMAHVYSPSESTGRICVAASKPVRVWLNGELVTEFDPAAWPGTWSCDAASFAVTLRRGRNVLLVKGAVDPVLHVRLGDHPYEQGMELARYGLWKEASDRLESVLGRSSESYVNANAYLHFAAFKLAAGDQEAVRQLYADLQSQPNWVVPATATISGLNWIGSSAPRVADDEALLLQRAESLRGNPDHWLRNTVPMAYSRLGRWREVVDFYANDAFLRQQGEAPPLLALAHHHLGNAQEAQAEFAKALETIDREYEWWNRVVLHSVQCRWMLPREASLAISGSAEKVDQGFNEFFRRRREMRDLFPRDTREFDTAIQIFPDRSWHWLARARRRAELGDVEEARSDFLKAKELAPKDRRVSAEFGAFLAKHGEIAAAADEYWRGLHLGDDIDWLTRAREFESYVMNQPEVLDELLRRWPEDAGMYRLKGERLARLGRWEEARNLFDSGPDYISHAEASGALCLLLNDLPGYDAASKRVEQESRKWPSWVHQFKAIFDCLGPRESADAERILATIRQRDPSPDLLVQKLAVGLAEYRAGNFEQALNELSTSTTPLNGWQITGQIWPARALAHARLGQLGEARRCLEHSQQSLELARQATLRHNVFGGPNSTDVYWLFALVLHREARTILDGTEAAWTEMAHFRNVGAGPK